MIFEVGYGYYSEHPLDCFIGRFKLEGYMIHDTEDTYHGYLKLLGKKHPLYDCKVVNGRYNYKVDALGMTMQVDALVDDKDLSISGSILFPGNRTGKVEGGAVRRITPDGKEEKVGSWKN